MKIKLLTAIAALLLLASTSYAATAPLFDVDLSDSVIGGEDLTDVSALDLYSPLVNLSLVDDGTFTESGPIFVQFYEQAGADKRLRLAKDLYFQVSLSGTYEIAADGITHDFTFDPGQSISLLYGIQDDSGDVKTTVAEFALQSGASGQVIIGSPSTQNYMLTLTNNPLSVFDNSLFGSTLVINDFDTTGFSVMGEFTAAVPVPSSVLLIGSGLIGLVGLRRKNKQ